MPPHHAGMSTLSPEAARTAAQRAQRGASSASAIPQFFTKRVADPGMIPLLVATGVEFGAVKVAKLAMSPNSMLYIFL